MHPRKFHYEVLLFTGTSLAERQLRVVDGASRHELPLMAQDRLDPACWKRLLDQWLGVESSGKGLLGQNGHIRDVRAAAHFLHIQMGLSNLRLNDETSLDPHFFIGAINSN